MLAERRRRRVLARRGDRLPELRVAWQQNPLFTPWAITNAKPARGLALLQRTHMVITARRFAVADLSVPGCGVSAKGLRGGGVREVEVKYRVRDPEALFVALTAAKVRLGRQFARMIRHTRPKDGATATASGRPFRTAAHHGRQHLFTLKRPAENALSCYEHECEVSDCDQMHSAITAMGFYPTVRIVKSRRAGLLGDVYVCVDEIADLGTFLELERMVPADQSGETVQAELTSLVISLGIEAERVEETYDSLVRAAFASG